MTTTESSSADIVRPPLVESMWERDERLDLVDFTVGGLLAERASTHADVTALIGTRHGDGQKVRLTYAQLYDEALRVATALRALVSEGDFVAMWAPNVVEWPIVEYGAALAGVVLVALNPGLRTNELAYALEHSGSNLLLHADSSRDYDMAAVVQQIRSTHPNLRTVSLSERSVWRADAVAPETLAGVPQDPNAPVMLQYTSGTTGKPKGVLLRHRSLVNVARFTLDYTDVARGAVTVNPLPMFHTAACVIGTLGPLWIGGTSCLVEQFAPGRVLDIIRGEKASVLFYVPAMLDAILHTQRESDEPAPQLHTIIGGASTVSASMIEAAEKTFGAVVLNLFGQTELSPVLMATRRGDSRADQLTTVGHPLPQVDCKVADPMTGEVVPIGVVGEICARGYQQMIGYLHDPEATSRTVDSDGFVHTGDLGAMDERGYVRLTGRLKELIIRGGENIAPIEIELCLGGHESVDGATVVGIPDARMGEIVVAVVRVRGVEPADLRQQLEDHARRMLSPHKIPGRWFVADELPATPTGKIRKFLVVDQIVSGALRELL